jgi:hypothetical protein
MEKAPSFFRVFDLAFFAPGAVLYWVLHTHGYMEEFDPLATTAKLADVSGLVAILSAIVLIYLLGVIVQASRELVQWIFPRIWEWASSAPNTSGSSWYQGLAAEAKDEIASYFWYMRATCFNLCVTGVLVAIFAWVQQSVGPGVAAFASAALVYWLGTRYDRALHRVRG